VQVSKAHLDFIPRIYNTVINSDAWVETLNEFAYHCGASASTVIFADRVNPELVGQHISTLFNVDEFEDYKSRFSTNIAEAVSHLMEFSVHTWVPDEIGFRKKPEEIPANLYMAEHFGVFRRTAARLNNTPIWTDCICVNYDKRRDNMSDEEDKISQFFLPHFSKCVELNRPFQLLKTRFNAILSVLDRLQIGVCILDATGSLLLSNREAQAILDAGNGLSQSNSGKLLTTASANQDQLNQIIATVGDPTKISNINAKMTIPKRKGYLPWLLEAFPASDLEGSSDSAFTGVALFLIDPERQDVVSVEGMQLLFNLTEAENEVCKLLTQGQKIDDISEVRNVSPITVKRQVGNLFVKTETKSQADLIRLALKVNLPVDRNEDVGK